MERAEHYHTFGTRAMAAIARRWFEYLAPLAHRKEPGCICDTDTRNAGKRNVFVLTRKRVNDSGHGSSSALDDAVRDVLRCNCGVFRDVFRSMDRSRLNAANANSERKND